MSSQAASKLPLEPTSQVIQILEKYLMFILQDLDDDTDIESAKEGLRLIGRAAQASIQRVYPDGIVPGRLSSRVATSARAQIEPL